MVPAAWPDEPVDLESAERGNRLTQIVDTQGGVSKTITRVFDDLDRLTQESTDQGEVNYTYDNASRRTSMTLKNGPAGSQVAQPTLSYTWDDADRLTLITQAAGASNGNQAQTVAFQYDDANRPTKTTYTSGMSVNTTYTDAGEVKTLKYLKADNSVIAQGGYTYDFAGRRIGVSGDLANFVGTQGPDITDASYNAANQMITWGGKTFSYDFNGNMTGDGVTTYTWDARDQLAGVNNAMTNASFKYDSPGRRVSRTLGAATTAFNYDGDNFVQELDAAGRTGNITANLITGGIDQHFMRQTTINGQPSMSWIMTEANNSTVVQTDGQGAVQKTFQYTPYGTPVATTGASTDSQRYTGREDDGTGLHYYRARYYRPDCMRFISEDPIGWASGQVNNYAYVGGDPVYLNDPLGLDPHSYEWSTFRCMGDCTAQTMKELRCNPAPGVYPANQVQSGDKNIVGVGPKTLGPIVTTVDAKNKNITNTTLPGHMLHPGWVQRQVVFDGKSTWVKNTGGGDGALATINELGAPIVWGGTSPVRLGASVGTSSSDACR